LISKGFLLKAHRWLGLCACALILLQALTGAALVFRAPLAERVDPDGMVRHTASGEAPLSQVLAAVEARYPGGDVQRIVWPQRPQGVYFVHLADRQGQERFATVDPGDARVLRAGGLWRFPMEAVLAIHFRLVTGKIGLAVMLFSGIAVVLMAVSGLAYWWPKTGRWKTALQVNLRRPAGAVLRQLHRAGGAVVAVLALVSAVTGLLVGGEYLLEPGPLTEAARREVRTGAPAAVDRALAAARAVHPGPLRDVRLGADGSLGAYFWAPARSVMAVDAVKTSRMQGRVVAVKPASDDRSLWVTILPLHSGEAFGLAGQLTLFAGGLGLAALAVTGPILWLMRRP
jgi:uncharacterized iron-regulated membrane protein